MDTTDLAAAVERFYDALNGVFAGDAGPMNALWSHAPEVTCMGPAGDLLVGWAPIEATWVTQAGVVESGTVRPDGLHVYVSGDLGVSVGWERGHVVVGGHSSIVAARATNVFRREQGSWRMIGHHTDPHSDPHPEAS
jgi:ketosteroid isomerase-like protein